MANPACTIEGCGQPATFIGTFFDTGLSVTVCGDHFIDFAAGTLEAMTEIPVTLLLTLPPEAFAEIAQPRRRAPKRRWPYTQRVVRSWHGKRPRANSTPIGKTMTTTHSTDATKPSVTPSVDTDDTQTLTDANSPASSWPPIGRTTRTRYYEGSGATSSAQRESGGGGAANMWDALKSGA